MRPPRSPRPSVAAVNGPAAALDRLLGRCEERGVRARRIAVGYASHSPQMNRLAGRLLADLAPVTPGPAGITLISTLTGEPADGTGLGAEYWVDNLRRTAGCAAAVRPRSPGAHGSERPVADDMVVSWNTAETIVEVPGNHWTMMRRYADSTARAVDEWLSSRFDADVSERGESGLFARNLSGVAEESRRQHD